MVPDRHDGLLLESDWTARTEGDGVYRLVLTNRDAASLADFRLAFCGPARASDDTPVIGGKIVRQLSNYCEIAPEKGASLAPGTSWAIEIGRLDYPIRHWTDGATSAFVILADGTTRPVVTRPTRLAGSNASPKRGTMRFPVPEHPPVPVSVVPWPAAVAVSGRRTAPDGLALIAEGETAGEATSSFAALAQRLFPGEGMVRDLHAGGFPVDCGMRADMGAEAYEIAFTVDRVAVRGGSRTGLFYGLVTLGQIQRGARLHPAQFLFPTAGRISDSPRMGWRGCHLDVARRFRSRTEIEHFLAILAWNKLNVFHWHLSDDEAWRVEVESCPDLTAVAAWRGHGLAIPPLLGTGPERSGGFYTKADVREIVALASGYGIDIVPEIDVPGHCYAMLQALPQLRDPGETGAYHSIQAFPNNCLNPAVEQVYEVLEAVLGELCDLFPSAYFHVGADEVPADAWAHSPAANRLRTALGVVGAAPLQAHFLKRVQALLTKKGKITGAWEEAAHGGGIDRASCYLVGWHSVEASQRLAREGYAVVVAPGQAYYLDMASSPDWHECGAAWAGWSSPEKTYAFDPVAGWSESERARLKGVQACIWAEPTTDRAVFDRLVFPRLSAIAETAWTREDARDYARFAALVGLMPNLYGQYEES